MNYLQEIASLISIRNFLVSSIDNLHIKLSREEVKNIQTRVQYLDKFIVDHAIKADLSKIGKDNTIREFLVQSSEDTEKVMKRLSTETSNETE